MCGIVALMKTPAVDLRGGTLEAARAAVRHRGPDSEGARYFYTSGTGYRTSVREDGAGWVAALGHQRLSIIDLADTARQPMLYRERWWVIYNGEIYNYLELRRELESLGHAFATASDTEVILAAYAEWGAGCFARMRGMWALVLLDAERRVAVLSRDRLGIKPLHIWTAPGLLAAVSEIKQLQVLDGFRPRLDGEAADLFLEAGYEVPGRTLFQGVRSLPAGTWCEVPLNSPALGASEPYWHPERVQPGIADPREAALLFRAKLEESVCLHLRSDVPVGCAVSGGLDSSALVVLAEPHLKACGKVLDAFTVRFPGFEGDESLYVDRLLAASCARRHSTIPDEATFLRDLPAFLRAHDEPLGSLSMYAGYALARLSREAGVPVLLNGQGGDELLFGYWQTYFLHLRSMARRGSWGRVVAEAVGALLPGGNPSLWGQAGVMVRRLRSRRRGGLERRGGRSSRAATFLERLLDMDEQSQRVEVVRSLFLPRLLKWDDRNSMAFSVEGRYPFLDHELIDLCLAFDTAVLFRRGWTKRPLREGLSDALPASIRLRRTKFGFEVPQLRWMRAGLRGALDAWVRADRPLRALVDWEQVAALWARLVNGGASEEDGQVLFRLWVFDMWLELYGVDVGA